MEIHSIYRGNCSTFFLIPVYLKVKKYDVFRFKPLRRGSTFTSYDLSGPNKIHEPLLPLNEDR